MNENQPVASGLLFGAGARPPAAAGDRDSYRDGIGFAGGWGGDEGPSLDSPREPPPRELPAPSGGAVGAVSATHEAGAYGGGAYGAGAYGGADDHTGRVGFDSGRSVGRAHGAGADGHGGHGGLGYPGPSPGQPQLPQHRPTTATPASVPRLQLDAATAANQPLPAGWQPAFTPAGLGASEVTLGRDCEREIDRLVKERLEGVNTDRTQTRNRIRHMAEYNYTWAGRMELVVRAAGQSFLTGLQRGSNVLLGRIHSMEPGRACKRVVQAVPIVIYEGDEEDDFLDPSAPPPGSPPKVQDDFSDLITAPAASSSARTPAASAPAASTPTASASAPSGPGAAEDGIAPLPGEGDAAAPKGRGPAPRSGRRPGDTASALSATSAMTSSAAQLLGGLTAPPRRPAAGAAAGSAKADDGKSVLGPSSGMSSSAASALGALAANSSARRPAAEGAAEDSKSVLPPSATQRRAAGGRADDGKSVLGPASGMNSSAASALSALGNKSQAAKKSGGATTPGRSDDKKSAIASSQGASSSAAAALGPMASGATRGASPAPAASTSREDSAEPAASGSARPAGRSAGGAKKNDQKTVISGLNSSSAASSLLGPMMQAQGQAKRRARPAGEATSTIG